MSTLPRILQMIEWEKAAEEYLKYLRIHRPEHFMEATGQGTQRAITLASLDVVHGRRSEVQVFNELLVQYLDPATGQRQQVVPDKMVILHDQPIRASGSYNVPFQPVSPFWVLEYVSKDSERKDYDESFAKYERGLKVPYYLTFYPDEQELSLYRFGRKDQRYASVKPNRQGWFAIPKLEIEVAIHEEWARFWYQGELLPLPRELWKENQATRQQLDATRQELHAAEEEIARLKAEIERRRNGGH
jgi:Putative restriction endonuclease